MKFLMIILVAVSCGKKETTKKNTCKSRYQKMQECYRTYNVTHHPYYVQRVCAEKYPMEGCYK